MNTKCAPGHTVVAHEGRGSASVPGMTHTPPPNSSIARSPLPHSAPPVSTWSALFVGALCFCLVGAACSKPAAAPGTPEARAKSRTAPAPLPPPVMPESSMNPRIIADKTSVLYAQRPRPAAGAPIVCRARAAKHKDDGFWNVLSLGMNKPDLAVRLTSTAGENDTHTTLRGPDNTQRADFVFMPGAMVDGGSFTMKLFDRDVGRDALLATFSGTFSDRGIALKNRGSRLRCHRASARGVAALKSQTARAISKAKRAIQTAKLSATSLDASFPDSAWRDAWENVRRTTTVVPDADFRAAETQLLDAAQKHAVRVVKAARASHCPAGFAKPVVKLDCEQSPRAPVCTARVTFTPEALSAWLGGPQPITLYKDTAALDRAISASKRKPRPARHKAQGKHGAHRAKHRERAAVPLAQGLHITAPYVTLIFDNGQTTRTPLTLEQGPTGAITGQTSTFGQPYGAPTTGALAKSVAAVALRWDMVTDAQARKQKLYAFKRHVRYGVDAAGKLSACTR